MTLKVSPLNNIEIVKASVSDSQGILNILKQVHLLHQTNRPDIFKANTSKYSYEDVVCLINNKDYIIFVAKENDLVVGYVIGIIKEVKNNRSLNDEKSFFIDDFCVDEKHRRQHIGVNLYKYVKNYAKENGFNNITLHVWSFNKESIEFYKYLGMDVRYLMMEDNLK